MVELVVERKAAVAYHELDDAAGESLRSWDPERGGNTHPPGLRYPLDRVRKHCGDLGLPILPPWWLEG